MQLTFAKGLMTGVAAAAILLAITAAGNGNGPGSVFNLGRTNKVNLTSTLTGNNRGPMLTVTNAGRGTALNLNVGKGRAPLSVNSTGQVDNLNSSLLDGLTASAFVHGGGQMKAVQFALNPGQTKTLLKLPSFGTFDAVCVAGPSAVVRFSAGAVLLRLWRSSLTGTSTSLIETLLTIGDDQFSTAVAPAMFDYTVQNLSSGKLKTHMVTAQVEEMASGSSCDFALEANVGS